MVGESDQHLFVLVQNSCFSSCKLSFIQAKYAGLEKQQLWDSLLLGNLDNSPSLISGDFNVIT